MTGRKRLRSGDHIRIGSSTILFRSDGRASGELTAVADAMPTRESLTKTQREILIALCAPRKHNAGFAAPATNQQIADRMYLSVETVKTHMRALFAKFGIEDVPQNQKRARLVERAMQSGIVTERDL
ncbi:LuxR family transcriptional regulator [Rhodococcus opacus RKJ300 = JCM 13270]|uniref:LuxR family transcriptional regulator n=2 Tax=Nocardiaceae TaxID=85025 RepID=I0WTQ5_RHOOP|nr:LuxR family transcriptional regulator [Rhodococcus opacus RKJ300 = JCM 13270]